MKFLSLIKHLIVSLWRNAPPYQAALISAFLLIILIFLLISVVQVIIPFTYIAI